jgi:uncharacterized protein involved in exopolysaccharide biosynthesis
MLRVILWAALLAGVGAAIGLGVAKFTTPLYEGRATMLASTSGDASSARGDALTMLRQPSLFELAIKRAAKSHPELESPKQATLLPRHDATQGDGASALEVRVQSPNPEIASDVANAMVEAYNDAASKSNTANASSQRLDLSRIATVSKARVDSIQKDMQQLEQSTGVLSVDSAISRAGDYQATLTQQDDADRAALEASKKALEKEQREYDSLTDTTTGSVVEGPNPKLEADIADLQKLEAQRVELLGVWLPGSEKVKAVDVKIAAAQDGISKEKLSALTVQRKDTQPNPLKQNLAKEISDHTADIARLTASVSEVGKAQQRQKQVAKSLPADQARMLQLSRELSLANDKYKAARATADQLDLKGSTTQLPLLNTFLAAEPSNVPVWPDYNLMISVGAAIGLLLGVIVGISTMARAEELATQMPLPTGPVGPSLPSGMTAPPLPARRGEGLAALALPSAGPAEAYRFMVFSMLSSGDDPARTVLFTGVSSDSLCSEAAAQFAIAMSQSGVRTLLADCNLRHHGLTEAFGFKGKSGISDMLNRTMLPVPGSDLILATEHPDLYFMPSGSEESEGLGSFQSLQITGLVQELKERADVKVLNTPACAMAADAPRLVRYADHVCLVASKSDRNRGLVTKAQEILKRAGAGEVDVLVIDRDESKDSFLG